MKRLLTLAITGLLTATPALAQDDTSTRTLITNVNIFDGSSERLIEGRDVAAALIAVP